MQVVQLLLEMINAKKQDVLLLLVFMKKQIMLLDALLVQLIAQFVILLQENVIHAKQTLQLTI